MSNKEMSSQVSIFLIPILRILSNPEYQKRIWLKQAGPEVDSYIESVENFSEISDAFLHNTEMQELLGSTSCETLIKLSEEIEAFHKTLRGQDIENIQRVLSNPKWHAIQKLSKELYNLLTSQRFPKTKFIRYKKTGMKGPIL